jgi:hypothetical protein
LNRYAMHKRVLHIDHGELKNEQTIPSWIPNYKPSN